jgi:hypothetical protein
VWIGEDLYYAEQPGSYYVNGSKYKFTYCAFDHNGTKHYNTLHVNANTGGGTLSQGFIFEPEMLVRVKDDGTV